LTLLLNGHAREFAALSPTATLQDLVQHLELKGDRIAIEHNGNIASRSQWASTSLHDNDKLEIVHFVGGGTGSLSHA
jgi:sulfur carrier protein